MDINERNTKANKILGSGCFDWHIHHCLCIGFAGGEIQVLIGLLLLFADARFVV
jgi:hypothetical protein